MRIEDREDVGEDVDVVECGLYAIVCVGETSDIVGVTSVGETSVLLCRRRRNALSLSTREHAVSSLRGSYDETALVEFRLYSCTPVRG